VGRAAKVLTVVLVVAFVVFTAGWVLGVFGPGEYRCGAEGHVAPLCPVETTWHPEQASKSLAP
jgi:hypothetical protein